MKSRNNHIKILFTAAVACLTLGCSKINEINVSPNNPSIDKATPQVLFPSGVISTAAMTGGELNIIGGIWSQYWTQSPAANQFKTIDSYNLQRQDFNRGYNELFSGALADYQLAIDKAKANNQNQFLLMCTVMKAYTYEVLVDLYDKVPYTDAFQGAKNLQPKFDDGYDVYKALIAEIDAALATDYDVDLSAADSKVDLLFGGDGTATPADQMANWRKFANTLKLKMYLRMVNTHAAEAEAGVRALYAANAEFLDRSAVVDVFKDETDQRNPIYEYTVKNLGANDLRASKTFTSWLVANDDARIKEYFGTAAPTPIDQGNFNAPQTAQPGYYIATAPAFGPSDPVYFLTEAESYFLQAEAAARYNVGNASSLYTDGVNAAFAQYDLPAPTTGVYAYPNSGNFQTNLRAIIYQKWASYPNSHALEGFFDQERTGYPEISPVYSLDPAYKPGEWVYSKNGVTGGKFPKRLVYPDVERSRNSNTPPEVPITTPVWWGLPN
ncbi:SusD/RagB family nutrient-binding outer membrane lipoprotein [Mucilaginibacter sp. 14171R-50]|uniref:SusD/RagB family nutrient-binding outer membrane lipoprotein n=1 Tax=Mucilaginibacter sp. 14171R-50 TaxID=2703789 RepID=UPI00138BD210|nr:SusD/RagB family nutrient-binding outer membrane lipoprotein [Mucilaginibacter sp. 14171R-50]QHS56394.1 SusD/RagB family nutrient-binding outer membrane lipoprotein [Mucilaginibacter sp. 14171R-50]